MSDSYLEQRVNIQPTAKLEKYADENFDMVKDFCNDKESQEQDFLTDTTNLEEVGKINVMNDEEIIQSFPRTSIYLQEYRYILKV